MGDVVDDVVDVITAPIEWIGDVVSDVGEWAVDEIVDPVFDAVDDVIDAVEDDPVKAIATVAAVATGNAWAIPLLKALTLHKMVGISVTFWKLPPKHMWRSK